MTPTWPLAGGRSPLLFPSAEVLGAAATRRRRRQSHQSGPPAAFHRSASRSIQAGRPHPRHPPAPGSRPCASWPARPASRWHPGVLRLYDERKVAGQLPAPKHCRFAGAATVSFLSLHIPHCLGVATPTRFVDRTRAFRRPAHDIGCWLELCDIATRTTVEARRVALNARRGVRDCETKATGKALRAITELEWCADLVEQIAARPGSGRQGRHRTARSEWCRCTILTPDRSPRPPRKTGRVRLQAPSPRQRRRPGPQPRCRDREPAGRADAGPSHFRADRPVRAGPQDRHRRPRLRRSRRRGRPADVEGPAGGDPPQGRVGAVRQHIERLPGSGGR